MVPSLVSDSGLNDSVLVTFGTDMECLFPFAMLDMEPIEVQNGNADLSGPGLYKSTRETMCAF